MRTAFRVTDGMRSEKPSVAARAYLKAGFKLLLTHGIDANGRCTCGNRDCPHAGKHPIAEFFPNGANSATTNLDLIRKGLRQYPNANIATTLEGRTVVDVDGPKGKAAVDALRLPKTIEVRTKRGRHRHYLGALDDGAFKGDQVDVLTGSNRYVMLPPSLPALNGKHSVCCAIWQGNPTSSRLILGAKLVARTAIFLSQTNQRHFGKRGSESENRWKKRGA